MPHNRNSFPVFSPEFLLIIPEIHPSSDSELPKASGMTSSDYREFLGKYVRIHESRRTIDADEVMRRGLCQRTSERLGVNEILSTLQLNLFAMGDP